MNRLFSVIPYGLCTRCMRCIRNGGALRSMRGYTVSPLLVELKEFKVAANKAVIVSKQIICVCCLQDPEWPLACSNQLLDGVS